MKVLDVEQGSPEWIAARVGCLTASRIADVMAKTKTGWGASRANYAAEIITERLTGQPVERFVNDAMRWGTEKEPDAKNGYCFLRDADIAPVGLVMHPTIPNACASPDGLVGEDGLIEVKCPTTATHIDFLQSEAIPDKYVKQMMWQMACTGRLWCDFVSFDPRLPPEMQILIKRVPLDVGLMAELEREAQVFLAEIDRTIAQLKAKFMRAAA